MLLAPKQQDVWNNSDQRWNVLVGAVSSGKTHIGYYLKAKRMRQLPPGNCLLIGKTERTYKRNVLDPMREMFGEELVSQVKGDGTVNLFGRKCYIAGANDERSITKIQGLSLVYAHGDEFTTWPESFFQMLKSRLRQPGACCDLDANPEGPFHWAKTFIDDTPNLASWHFVIDDNPFLEASYVDAIKAEYTGVWYKRYILGLWVAAEGAIYDMIDETSHIEDIPKREDGKPAVKAYYGGMDYGTASVTTFMTAAVGSDDNIYFEDRLRWDAKEKMRQKTDSELVDDLINWLIAKGMTLQYFFVPDDAQSFITQLHQTLHERRKKGLTVPIRTVVAASRTCVIDGIRDVASLFACRRLFFTKKLADDGGLKEWVSYVWDDKAALLGGDEPLKQNDHDPDCGRYIISGIKQIWYNWLPKGKAL